MSLSAAASIYNVDLVSKTTEAGGTVVDNNNFFSTVYDLLLAPLGYDRTQMETYFQSVAANPESIGDISQLPELLRRALDAFFSGPETGHLPPGLAAAKTQAMQAPSQAVPTQSAAI